MATKRRFVGVNPEELQAISCSMKDGQRVTLEVDDDELSDLIDELLATDFGWNT